MRFSVECAFPHLGKRDATSRKSAFWMSDVTEKRILHMRLTEKRILQPNSHPECIFS